MSTATRTLLRVRADELEAGDEIREEGSIPLSVDTVRVFHEHAFVVVGYSCTAGCGSRTLALCTRVTILRADQEAGH